MNTVVRYSPTKLDELMNWQGRQTMWLAERLGVDQSYVSKLRTGAKPLTDDLASRIAQILDIPVSFFLPPESSSLETEQIA